MFYVVNKQRLYETCRLETAQAVAAHMLGRRMSHYFVVKSDAQGDRVVPWPSSDVLEIQQVLEQA